MNRNLLSFIVSAAVSASCPGQSAVVRLDHDDPDGIVMPGETVGLTLSTSWQSAPPIYALSLHRIEGDILASPNAGTATNHLVPPVLGNYPGSSLNPGTPSNGSIVGIALDQGGLTWYGFGQFPPFPWGNSTGITLLTFDWTAPSTPGEIQFGWVASSSLPLPEMAWLPAPILRPIPTTYLGASLTVIPAPSIAAALLAAGLVLCPRRRPAG